MIGIIIGGGDPESCRWTFRSPDLGFNSWTNLAGGVRERINKGDEMAQGCWDTFCGEDICGTYCINEIDECKATALSQIRSRLETNYGFIGVNTINVNWDRAIGASYADGPAGESGTLTLN